MEIHRNKALFKCLTKIVAVILCINLIIPSYSFAGHSNDTKSQNDIKIMISAPDKYKSEAGVKSFILWSLFVTAVARASFSLGKHTKDEKAFKRGYDFGKSDATTELVSAFRKEKQQIASEKYKKGFIAGEESTNASRTELFAAGRKQGYKEGFEKGFENGYIQNSFEIKPNSSSFETVLRYPPSQKTVLTTKETRALAELKAQTRYLQVKLTTKEGILQAKNKIVVLIYKASNQTELLNKAVTKEEIETSRAELAYTVKKLAQSPIPDEGTRKVVTEYVSELSSILKSKGGTIGLAVAGIVAACAIMLCEQGESLSNISNTRAAVEREISATLKNAPEVFAVKVISLKEKYGIDMVSSVLYERQKDLPLLEQQLNVFKSAKIRQAASAAMQSTQMQSLSPSENKASLIRSFRG